MAAEENQGRWRKSFTMKSCKFNKDFKKIPFASASKLRVRMEAQKDLLSWNSLQRKQGDFKSRD
jgi:hypothetical protein